MQATQKPPLTASDVQVTPADILRGAARYLQLNGWIKGTFFDTTMDPGPAFPPACTGGAICAAATGQRLNPDALPTGPDGGNARRALVVFADHILDAPLTGFDEIVVAPADVIADWNDNASRTFTDVKAALNDAADEWDRLHPAVTA